MFVSNFNNIKEKIKCDAQTGRYLILNGIPELSRDGDSYYFANTNRVKKLIAEAISKLK